MRLWSKCIFITLLLALPAAQAQAESTGTIVGTVVDAEKGTVQDLAQVYIAELNRSAEWSEDGRFTMAKVPAGEYRITAELIGYESATETVVVVAGEVVSVELELMASAVELEEVVVTGTAVKESPISLTYAVAVTGREKMAEQGSPQAVDFFKNLSASHGVIGERSSWYNANQAATLSESIANVNLRGLGASRTLVLINSRRQTYVPARLIGGRFVDVNAIPSIAVDRVEVLKEGASAIYGSDAVAGVANFLTRSDFEGFEVSAAHEYIAGAGDSNVGAIWGGKIGEAHAVVAGEWRGRQALPASERDYLLQPWHGGGQRLGWSSLGNPGTFAVGAPAPWTAAIHAPRCEQFGGFRESWTCRFRYQQYENLIEDMSHMRAFAEINGALDNGIEYHFRGPVGRGGNSRMVHHAFVSSLPSDRHEHHGGRAQPSGPGGISVRTTALRKATCTTTNAKAARTGISTAARLAIRVLGAYWAATPARGAWRLPPMATLVKMPILI